MKANILILLLISLLLFSCASKFDNTQAEDVIKKSFELRENYSVEILGISSESKNEAIVKFKIYMIFDFEDEIVKFEIYEDLTLLKLRKYDSGWQIDEVQNVSGTWIPAEFFFEKEKQKDALKDIRTISNALAGFFIDNQHLPKQDGTYEENSELYKSLSPFYVKVLPIKDPWGNSYRVYCGKACNDSYNGIKGYGSGYFIIASFGRDGEKEFFLEFDVMRPKLHLFDIKSMTDFDKDLVMWFDSDLCFMDAVRIRAPIYFSK